MCLLWMEGAGLLFRATERDAASARLDMWAMSLEELTRDEARLAISDLANAPGVRAPITPATLREAAFAHRRAAPTPASAGLLPAGHCDRCDDTGIEERDGRSRLCRHAPLTDDERVAPASLAPVPEAVKDRVFGLGRRAERGGPPLSAGDVLLGSRAPDAHAQLDALREQVRQITEDA